MNKHLELQKEFQELAGQTQFGMNEIPDIETRKLRLKLALEELCELAEAFGMLGTFSDIMRDKIGTIEASCFDKFEYNQIEALDAMLDIEVINCGTIITCGFEEIFDREYENVDTNNKTKFHTSYGEIIKTENYYYQQGYKLDEIKSYLILHNNKEYYVVKNQYGKVLKPYNYKPVKLNLNK